MRPRREADPLCRQFGLVEDLRESIRECEELDFVPCKRPPANGPYPGRVRLLPPGESSRTGGKFVFGRVKPAKSEKSLKPGSRIRFLGMPGTG